MIKIYRDNTNVCNKKNDVCEYVFWKGDRPNNINRMKQNKTKRKKIERKEGSNEVNTLILMFVFRVRVKEGAYEGKISRC